MYDDPGERVLLTKARSPRDPSSDLSQREVVERLRLPFALLSDTDLALAETLGLPTFRAGGTTLFKRLTLVVLDGTIEKVFYPVFPPNEHAQQVLTWLLANPAAEH